MKKRGSIRFNYRTASVALDAQCGKDVLKMTEREKLGRVALFVYCGLYVGSERRFEDVIRILSEFRNGADLNRLVSSLGFADRDVSLRAAIEEQKKSSLGEGEIEGEIVMLVRMFEGGKPIWKLWSRHGSMEAAEKHFKERVQGRGISAWTWWGTTKKAEYLIAHPEADPDRFVEAVDAPAATSKRTRSRRKTA